MSQKNLVMPIRLISSVSHAGASGVLLVLEDWSPRRGRFFARQSSTMKNQNLNALLARRNELVASLDASRAAFRAFEKTQIEAVARADADLSEALKTQPEASK